MDRQTCDSGIDSAEPALAPVGIARMRTCSATAVAPDAVIQLSRSCQSATQSATAATASAPALTVMLAISASVTFSDWSGLEMQVRSERCRGRSDLRAWLSEPS